MLTFNGPSSSQPSKASRMSHTNTKSFASSGSRNFGNFTPNPVKKGSNHSNAKREKVQ